MSEEIRNPAYSDQPANELSENELNEVSGGIIAVLQPTDQHPGGANYDAALLPAVLPVVQNNLTPGADKSLNFTRKQ